MLSRAVTFLPQLASRIPKIAAFAARLYIALVVVQFLCGFILVVGLGIFGYDLDFISSFLPVENQGDSALKKGPAIAGP